jgi:hypothetical protein
MNIAFIGAGNMATGLGKHWAAKGHELFFSHSRDQDKLKKQAASVSAVAKVGTADEAAKFADVLILTTPYDASPVAIKACWRLERQAFLEHRQPPEGGLQRSAGWHHNLGSRGTCQTCSRIAFCCSFASFR